ncbi:MAG: hypothetical protein ABI448_09960 [Bacteroidia bacterium]
MKYCFLTFIVVAITFFSCKKDVVETPPDLGYDYYPGKIKSYVIYDVDSISYRQLPIRDTLYYKFQIKEEMDTLITDNENRPTIKLIRYKKIYSPTIPYSAMTWTLQDVWVANKNNTDVEVVEENRRYTKLAFPARLNVSWNGLAHADSTPVQNYQYVTYDAPITLNGNSFSKSTKVLQLYGGNKLYYQNYYEQYARGVGLVCRHNEDYKYVNNGISLDSGAIASGIYYVMTVNSYGTE